MVLRDIVEHIKANYPQDSLLESSFRYTKVIQEFLSHISRTCPSINNFDPLLVAVTPRKKDKKVRFIESLTSIENTKTDSTSNIVSNKRVLHSTRVRLSTSTSGSQPSGNTRNDKIQQTPSSNSKNKVEAHPRNVKSSLNKRNGIVKVNGSASVQNSKKHDNSDYVCINGDDCMSSDNLCVSNSMNDVKFRAKPKKSKSKKRKSKKDIWKPTGKVFTKMGYIWRPTGRTFTIVGNACPLTRITTTNEVPSRKPIVLESESPKPVVNLVYSRKPRKNKNTESLSKTEVVPESSSGIWTHPGFSKPMHRQSLISSPISSVNSWVHGLYPRSPPKLQFEKDHMFCMCIRQKFKNPHKPKSEGHQSRKTPSVHMDLLGQCVSASVTWKEYILVIYDQERLKETSVRISISTDNGTEFVNQTLRVNIMQMLCISHENIIARSPHQNVLLKRRNGAELKQPRHYVNYATLLNYYGRSGCHNLLYPKSFHDTSSSR
ncbi:retrovirus-related pol polyprotein from transposon TNT 1-94 [Tanacetum coccineum]